MSKDSIRKAIVWTFGGVMALTTLLMQQVSALSFNPVLSALQTILVFLALPGVILGMALSHNVHAFSLTVSAAINGLLYGCVGYAIASVVIRLCLTPCNR